MNLETILSLPPDKAAPLLLGATLIIGASSGTIVETEAYMPENDQAAHSARGKTLANSSLFSNAGTIYIHRMRHHTLIDIVTGSEGEAGSVLLRALEPVAGIEEMQDRRGTKDVYNLCNGPAKLCQALCITKEFDGLSIFDPKSPLQIVLPNVLLETENVLTSRRVGITKNADAPLRFFVRGSEFVS